jgi:trans-aconitate methyltransferase
LNEFTEKRWDAEGYNERFGFIWRHGAGVLALLDPKPGERVLDLGCGTGHLTAEIASRGADVVGIDHSLEMVRAARESYPELVFDQEDATDFSFEDPFDAVFSNAVLHWVHPPEDAARCINAALKPGGRLVAEMGAHGNVGQIVGALIDELEAHGYENAASRNPWYFPSISEYAGLLERHGLEPRMMHLYDRPTLLNGGENGLLGWLKMFADIFFAGVTDADRDAISASVVERLRQSLFRDGDWYADYRRLQVVAYRVD